MKRTQKTITAIVAGLFSLMLLLFGCCPPSLLTMGPSAALQDGESAQPEVFAPIFSSAEETAQSLPPEAAPGPDYSGMLRISEVMSKNKATLLVDGDFPDWVEIQNVSSEPVDLSDWSLSDRELGGRRSFSTANMPAGSLLLIPLGASTDLSLSAGETLYLLDPSGNVQDQAYCASDTADTSMVRTEDGFAVSSWPTPGLPNTAAGYELFVSSRFDASPLLIDEVMVSNQATPIESGEMFDYVTLRNNSDLTISLAGYTLTDKFSEPQRWSFPEKELSPGQEIFLKCDGENEASSRNTGFSLNAASEQLYLFDPEGKLADYIALHDIPIEGSMGRMSGQPGFFYFAEVTPNGPNTNGCRRISERPTSLTAEGVYDDCAGLSVSLSGAGEIHYSTDGSLPTLSSPLYTGPIEVGQTTVLRAISHEEGCITSRPASFSFIVNENHTLPVLSLTTDDPSGWMTVYNNGWRQHFIGANLTLFEDGDTIFNKDCELCIKGWTSRDLPKKSMGVNFTGRYGGLLEDADIYGNGITEYGSLSIRAGQDYTFSQFRNELFQDLCLEASDSLYTQESKYCVLYLNGRYWGIYCLKEDISRQYYASHAGVDKDTVEYLRAPFALGTDVMDLINSTAHRNMNEAENYQKVEDLFDIDSLIDWLLFESYSANTDTQGNLRIFRSPESGNKWQLVYYDLDWAFYFDWASFTTLVYGKNNSGNQMPKLYANISTNKTFRDKVFSRYAELCKTVLANDHVLELIDEYETLLEPEMPRDRERWDLTMERWHSEVDGLRNWIQDKNWCRYTINRLCTCFNATASEKSEYFGDLLS